MTRVNADTPSSIDPQTKLKLTFSAVRGTDWQKWQEDALAEIKKVVPEGHSLRNTVAFKEAELVLKYYAIRAVEANKGANDALEIVFSIERQYLDGILFISLKVNGVPLELDPLRNEVIKKFVTCAADDNFSFERPLVYAGGKPVSMSLDFFNVSDFEKLVSLFRTHVAEWVVPIGDKQSSNPWVVFMRSFTYWFLTQMKRQINTSVKSFAPGDEFVYSSLKTIDPHELEKVFFVKSIKKNFARAYRNHPENIQAASRGVFAACQLVAQDNQLLKAIWTAVANINSCVKNIGSVLHDALDALQEVDGEEKVIACDSDELYLRDQLAEEQTKLRDAKQRYEAVTGYSLRFFSREHRGIDTTNFEFLHSQNQVTMGGN